MEGSRLNLGARCSGDGCRRTASTAADRAQCHVGETCRPPSTDPPSFVGRLLHEQRRTDRAAVGCVHSGWAGDGTTRAAWFDPALLPLSL